MEFINITSELIIIYIFVFLLSIIQSIAGVGILVLGTPLLLLFDYQILNIMKILLPVSITSSVLNVLVIKFHFNFNFDFDFNFKFLKYFFLISLPGIFLGIIVLKKYSHLFNFDFLIAVIILISIFLKLKFSNFEYKNFKFEKFYTFILGVVHGITNSGGTLLTILLLNNNEKNSNVSRFNIHFFYFFLAFFQILFLSLLDNLDFNLNINLSLVFLIIIISTYLGNFISYKFKKITNIFIYHLAAIAAGLLVIKGIL